MMNDNALNDSEEKSYIMAFGGQGVLAVTRAFGDRRLKAYVSAEPELRSHSLGEGDHFLILAT